MPVHLLTLSFWDPDGKLLLNGANGLATSDLGRSGAPGVAVDPPVALAGKVDSARVASSVRGNGGLQQCYAKALGATPGLEGTVVFQALVDGGGRPTGLQVALEDIGEPTLVTCLGDSLRSLRLAGASPGSRLLLPLELRRL